MSLGKNYRIAAVATGEHASAMEAVGQSPVGPPGPTIQIISGQGGFRIGFDGHRVDIR